MMSKRFWQSLPTLILIPLAACGQSQTQQTTAASQPAAAASAAVYTPAAADAEQTRTLTEKLEKTYAQQNLKVLSVHTTPIAGLYEVLVSGNQLVYVDSGGNYMLVGDLLDINSRRSLTEERMADVNKVDYSKLPFDKAIKEVRGNGKLAVAVFSDPDCPFCKRLEHEFANMTDVTIYTFLMPIPSLHPQAKNKSEQIWCQSDRTAAWTAWMRENKAPAQVADCPNPVLDTMALGQQFGFNGTPTLVYPNGKTHSGYMPQAALQEALAQNQ